MKTSNLNTNNTVSDNHNQDVEALVNYVNPFEKKDSNKEIDSKDLRQGIVQSDTDTVTDTVSSVEAENASANSTTETLKESVMNFSPKGTRNHFNTAEKIGYTEAVDTFTEDDLKIKRRNLIRLTHKEFTLWKDTGDKVYSLIWKSIVLNSKEGKVYPTYLPHRDFILRLRVTKSGKMTLTRRGKLVFSTMELNATLPAFVEHFKELKDINLDFALYRLSRNPKLQAANFPFNLVMEYYTHPKAARKAYYYLSKGRTAEARSMLLTGIPNAPKGLLKYLAGVQSFTAYGFSPRDARGLVAEGVDVTLMASLVATYKGKDKQMEVLARALKLITSMESLKTSILDTLKKGTEEGLRLIDDTFWLTRYQQDGDVFTSLREAHDVLMGRQIEARNPNPLPRMETLYELPVYEKDGYKVVSMNAHDLLDLGRAMHICVGSYKDSVWLGKIAISAVYKDDKPVACLEWIKGHVTQAKLFANKKVKTDSAVTDVVAGWMEGNNLEASTSDLVGGSYPSGVSAYMEIDPERQKVLAEIRPYWSEHNNFNVPYQQDDVWF